ncbi:b066da8a-2a37-4e81-8fb9-239addd9fe2f [Thermothielavioides terrestris]|uniref:B066da8a-2a37-4e81-8fb9-239addd9fe2f n=1 Tax=Thermothielavioides terrestris TaxID=2587410 RepID=A0A3S4CAD8_9PEZI|nr:b066da8a-2a37-4e81-8fb9-239addd9fe2f [Thermothielavioides terrestris]
MAPHTSKAKAQSPASFARAPSPGPNLAITPPDGEELPMLELELLHNFTTKTHTTLAADSTLWEFWRDDVVQMGLACDYIMRAVLAVSALHLAYHRPDRRDFYTESGILLHQKAARSAMRVMAADHKIDKDQAANLFVFSMLTMFFALASPRRSNPDGTFFIGESGFPDWAFLLSGSKSIMDVLGSRGSETAAAPFLHYGGMRWRARRAMLDALKQGKGKSALSTTPPAGAGAGPAGKAGHEEEEQRPGVSEPESLLAPLRARIIAAAAAAASASSTTASGEPGRPDHLLHTYTHAVDELELALVAQRDPAAPRDVLDAMVWLWEVSDSLVPLLRVPTQEAVAIFAHFCVLLKHHESHWWLQGWADHIMARAHEILDAEHREWIEWPIREIGRMGLPRTGPER